MKKLELAGWVFVITAIMLFVSTTRTQDLDPAVRAKTEAVGGVGLREVGYQCRYKVRIVSSGFLCSGIACFLISSALTKLELRKKIANHH